MPRQPSKGLCRFPIALLWIAMLLLFAAVAVACGEEEPTKTEPTSPATASGTPRSMQPVTEAAASPPSGFSRALGANLEEDWVEWDKMERDWNALVALYNATGGDDWTNNEGWLSETPLGDWYGVKLHRDGTVDELSLENNNLIGGIPAELVNLSARYLMLGGNQLSGEIPHGLCSVIRLSLLNNQLSGRIPSLGCNPIHISLGNNQLSGEIPAELGNNPELRTLDLSNNQLSGEIPAELGNSSTLESLDLANNRLGGEIPVDYWTTFSLRELDLRGNPLSGCIRADLGDRSGYYFPSGMKYCK